MKRLKIAEQILIVLSLALIVPLVIASVIIINTNQIAVRRELISSATILANTVENELITLSDFEKENIIYAKDVMANMPNSSNVDFINYIKNSDKNILDFSVKKLSKQDIIPEKFKTEYLSDKKAVKFSYHSDDNMLITKTVNIDYINNRIFKNFAPQGRQVYILDTNKQLVLSMNAQENILSDILAYFPDNINLFGPNIFSKNKNQPNVLIHSSEFNWYVVIYSPKELADYGIVEARYKIILAILCAVITVFVLFGIYTFSLYTNIRQSFKVIRAIADGKYKKKLRYIIKPWTSQELVFIAEEFNKMIEKIDESYKELQYSNEKLKKMDEYKSNLIDTVSHEFRTPLTSIKGYSSSLLRHDINIDPDSRKKSLRIIKQQAERLSRMVEDLLVIPDIESATLRMDYKEVNLKNVIETSVLYTSKTDTSLFNINVDENIGNLYADEDRLIQIMVNLLENALKYSKENTMVNVTTKYDNDFAIISVQNEAEFIDKNDLDSLFDKFARIDSDLTRTTRGTGLGLFIVKGLVETMGGHISLSADNGFTVTFTIPLYKGQDENV